MYLDFKSARLVEIKVPKSSFKETTVILFSEKGSDINFNRDYYEVVPKLINNGFLLVSESWSSFDTHTLYFQKPKT